MIRSCLLFSLLGGIFAFFSCLPSSAPTQGNAFVENFPSRALTDTLSLGPGENGPRLEKTELYSVLDSAACVAFFPFWEEGDSIVALARFPLPPYEAAWLEMRHSWQYRGLLLLFESEQPKAVLAIPTHLLDGGEGGQLLEASWLLDWDGDEDRDWIRRKHGRFLILEEDSVVEETYDSLFLELWEEGQFRSAEIAQDSVWMRQFPIDW